MSVSEPTPSGLVDRAIDFRGVSSDPRACKARRISISGFVSLALILIFRRRCSMVKTSAIARSSTQRLLDAGFVRQGKQGLRGRTDYKVTVLGKKALNSGWRTMIQEGPSGDLDSDLRVALLAISVGANRPVAAEFLRQSSDTKIEALAIVDQRKGSTEIPPLAQWCIALRLAATKTLLEAESTAACTMAESLPRPLWQIQAGKPRD